MGAQKQRCAIDAVASLVHKVLPPACTIMLCCTISYRLSTTCWPFDYGPRLLKMRSSVSACAINVRPAVDFLVITLPVMVGSYPKCAVPPSQFPLHSSPFAVPPSQFPKLSFYLPLHVRHHICLARICAFANVSALSHSCCLANLRSTWVQSSLQDCHLAVLRSILVPIIIAQLCSQSTLGQKSSHDFAHNPPLVKDHRTISDS